MRFLHVPARELLALTCFSLSRLFVRLLSHFRLTKSKYGEIGIWDFPARNLQGKAIFTRKLRRQLASKPIDVLTLVVEALARLVYVLTKLTHKFPFYLLSPCLSRYRPIVFSYSTPFIRVHRSNSLLLEITFRTILGLPKKGTFEDSELNA